MCSHNRKVVLQEILVWVEEDEKINFFWLIFPVLKSFIKIFEARNEQATALLETVSALKQVCYRITLYFT